MEEKPFSAPVKNSQESSSPTILPPTSVSIGKNTNTINPPSVDYNVTNPTISAVNPAAQTILVNQPKESNTVANVFMIIGVVVLVVGLGIMALGVLQFGDTLGQMDEIGAKKISKIQPLLNETIVFSSDGNTINESFEFDNDVWYQIRIAQGVTVNSISILDENNNTLFFEEDCDDWNYEDGIDDCKDYTTVDIGNIDLERSKLDNNSINSLSITGTININATGEVTINKLDDDFFEEVFEYSAQIDEEYFAGPTLLVGFGVCVGCCVAPVGILVGIIIRFV